jgi:hypothetical protein
VIFSGFSLLISEAARELPRPVEPMRARPRTEAEAQEACAGIRAASKIA